MATRKKAADDDPVAAAIAAAEEAGARFAQAKSELEHRLADIDGALVEMIQRVYDATPPEYQRTFRVREPGLGEEELPLPDFVRYAMERPRGTTATFTIDVIENLYADGDDDEEDFAAEDESDDEPAPAPARAAPRTAGGDSGLSDFDPSDFEE
jgi:hypothetical protein